MRRSVVCCVVSCTIAGCWHSDPDDSGVCAVVLVRPGNVDAEVAIRPTLRLEWSTAVELSDARVHLRDLDGHEVPVTIVPEGDRIASVTTAYSLRFDTVYKLEVSPVAAHATSDVCVGSTTAFKTVTPYEVEQPPRMASLQALARIDRFVIGSSHSYRGLQIFDIGQPDAPLLAATLPTDEQPHGVVISGTRAYVPTGDDGVIVLDVSDPATPIRLGVVGSPGSALGVSAFDRGSAHYIAIADGTEGVRIVDVTDPVAPRTVSVVDPSGARAADVRAVDVDGTLLAIADGTRGFSVFDVTDPANPARVGSGTAGRAAVDVAIHGGLVYVAHFPAFVDVYDPGTVDLARVGGVMACNVCMQRYPVQLHEAGDQLHVTAAREGVRTYALDGSGGMRLLGTRQTPGPAFAVIDANDRVYVGEEGGLVAFDRATFTPARFMDSTATGNVSSVIVVDGLAYAAAASRGLHVFDLGDPELPRWLGATPTPASPSGDISAAFVTAIPEGLLVGDVRGGLVSFDRTSGPMMPALTGQLQVSDGVTKMVALSDGVVLGCQGNTGVFLADVSDPGEPKLIAERFFRDVSPSVPDYCIDLLVDDTTMTAYVAGAAGITVLDLGDPEAEEPLRVVERVALPSRDIVLSLARRERVLYATTQVEDFEGRRGVSSRLQVFDLSDPRRPAFRWATPDLGAIGSLALAEDVAFAAARDLGIYVFDLSVPREPVVQYLIPTRGDAVAIAVTPHALYVAESAGGLGVVHTGPLPVVSD